MRFLCSAAALSVLLCHLAAGQAPTEIFLRPFKGFVEAHSQGLPLPFYQAVPLARGEFVLPDGGVDVLAGSRRLPLQASVAAHWPDGSAQWLAISGVWPADEPLSEAARVRLAPASTSVHLAPQFSVRPEGSGVAVLDVEGNVFATLRPEAAAVRIVRPKAPDSRNPEDFDTVVQYAWAEPVQNLNPEGHPVELRPRAREFIVEEQTPASVLYRLRGDGGEGELGEGLEWQLRVRAFRHSPVLRFQMTWFFHWNPDEVALTKAHWVAEVDDALQSATGAGRRFSLAQGPVSLSSTATGQSKVEQGGESVLENEWPDADLHVWTVQNGGVAVGVALPDFTRLGPNRLTLRADGGTVGCWDGQSGKGLDMRRTVERDEFMMNDYDFDATAEGVARTVEMAWAVHPDAGAAGAMARAEAARDGLWFANREDMLRGQALGPWREGAFERNRTYAEALGAQIHWVKASRDYWRWNGFINFGDIRTNWHRTGFEHTGAIRVHPMMWGLEGRYGWRNGSGEPYRGFLTFGLWAEDRDIMLFAFDYARHVADVDVVHGRFGQPLTGDQGGMHRRNKNHWSGAVQMQYTPSRGMYLMKWLTGFERFGETLAEIRDYSTRHARGNTFGASSWLSHYSETLNPEHLAKAEELLGQTAAAWEERLRGHEEYGDLRGLRALHAGNFRKYLNWWPVQIEFHRATEDPKYLEILAENVKADPLTRANELDLSRYYAIAYLMSHGYTEEQLGAEKIQRLREALERRRFGENPPREEWDYETLVRRRATFQSYELGCRASNAPLALGWFDSGEAGER